MKKEYCSPEAELLCFSAREALATTAWDYYSGIRFAAGESNPSQVDMDIPGNPEGGFND